MENSNIPQPLWDHEIRAIREPAAEWLWHGFVAGGNVTLLTSLWKAGKTTLLSMLLSRRKQGGTLAGLHVKPGKTAVVSEEPARLWGERARKYDFGGQVCFFTRPFRTIPTLEEWQTLIDRILEVQQQHGIDLVVIDPLAPYLRGENSSKNILESLLPLAELTQRGMAVLLLHHPAKGERPVGQSARGSGALLGHVDVSIEMRHPGGDVLTRRRRFLSLSRHADTPRQLLLELTPEGSDYVPVPEQPGEQVAFNWEAFRLVLEDAPQKLTSRDILVEWPEQFDKPTLVTLRKWLQRAVDNRMVLCEGSGKKSNPFRYWLPEMEAVWKETNPLYEILEQQRKDLKLPFQALHERKRTEASERCDDEGDDGREDVDAA
jgi:AAA domain